MKHFRRLAAAVREVFHPQPWDPPERDETTPELIAGWIGRHRHPDACRGGCQCERGGG